MKSVQAGRWNEIGRTEDSLQARLQALGRAGADSGTAGEACRTMNAEADRKTEEQRGRWIALGRHVQQGGVGRSQRWVGMGWVGLQGGRTKRRTKGGRQGRRSVHAAINQALGDQWMGGLGG